MSYPLNKQDKWLLVSCLQKSIRKGFVDLSLDYADELYEIEKSYLLYRLSIIALEDVGLGNIPTVSDFLSTEIKKTNIEEKGGKDYVMNIVQQLALSDKDRSACDLTYLASFYAEKNNNNNNSTNEEIFTNPHASIVSRVLSGWQVLGAKKQKNPFIQNLEDDINKFIELNSKITSDNQILDIIRSSYKFQREPHFIALGLLSFIFNSEKNNGGKIGSYNVGDVIEKKYTTRMCGRTQKWLIDGIDWHTSEGKKAIYDFSYRKNSLTQYLKENLINPSSDDIAQNIGSLLFRENGHCVDKRLLYPSSILILKNATIKSFERNFKQPFDLKVVTQLMRDNIDELYTIIEKNQITPNISRLPI